MKSTDCFLNSMTLHVPSWAYHCSWWTVKNWILSINDMVIKCRQLKLVDIEFRNRPKLCCFFVTNFHEPDYARKQKTETPNGLSIKQFRDFCWRSSSEFSVLKEMKRGKRIYEFIFKIKIWISLSVCSYVL